MTTPIYGPQTGPSNLSDGVVNDTVIDSIRRFLPPAFRNKPGWDALTAAIAAGDETVRDNVYKAFAQLFLSAASGNYLIQRAADRGITYPENAGITEELFRELAILLANERQTAKALLGILEVFYGEDATHARLVSEPEPYDLTAGDTLTFLVDDRFEVTWTVDANDFEDVGAATALEVAGSFTRAFQNASIGAYATAKEIDGQNRIVVYSGAIGLLGSIKVTGGFANRQFDIGTEWVDTYVGQQWRRTRISLQEFRLTWTQAREPGNLVAIQVGDFVTFDCVNAPELRGSYEVTDVHIDAAPITGSYANLSWFSIRPTPGFPWDTLGGPATTFQALAGEIVFFSPFRSTVALNPSPSFIAQHQDGVDIIMPAITQAVGRAYNAAAYLHAPAPIDITEAWRFPTGIVVVLSVPPTFITGDMVELSGIRGEYTAAPPPIGGSGNGCGGWNIIGPVAPPPLPLPPNSFFVSSPRVSYELGHGVGGKVYPMAAASDPQMGPFVADNEGFAITSTATTIANDIGQGTGLSVLEVASTLGFPNQESWLVTGFGYEYEAGPIRCLGVIDGTHLAIDRSFVFPSEVPAGASVTLLSYRGPYVPDTGERTFALTDSVAGRIAASDFIDETAAAGIEVNKIVVYPGDRGLGGEGDPLTGLHLSDRVAVWAGDDVDQAVEDAHGA